MKPGCLAIILFAWLSSFSQDKCTLREQKADSITCKLDSVLIIGVGSTPSRIFLDNLSEFIMMGLEKDSIQAKYYYLGRTSSEARPLFDTINKVGYKAVLFLLKKGSTLFDVQGNMTQINGITSRGPANALIATSGILFVADFDFMLRLPNQHMTQVWGASAEVSCDPRYSKIARNLGNKLLMHFRKDRYIK